MGVISGARVRRTCLEGDLHVTPSALVAWMLWGSSRVLCREGVRWPRQSLAVGVAQPRTPVAGEVALVEGPPGDEGQVLVEGGRAGR